MLTTDIAPACDRYGHTPAYFFGLHVETRCTTRSTSNNAGSMLTVRAFRGCTVRYPSVAPRMTRVSVLRWRRFRFSDTMTGMGPGGCAATLPAVCTLQAAGARTSACRGLLPPCSPEPCRPLHPVFSATRFSAGFCCVHRAAPALDVPACSSPPRGSASSSHTT
jgi:hypothetical protein